MNIYWVIGYFEEWGQNDNFHLKFKAKLQGEDNDLKDGSIIILFLQRDW